MAAVRRLLYQLRSDELHGRVTLVPVVNESAFRLGRRVAEDGLDLARICPGRADGSVTEQIACALSELIRSADYYIDLHTGGTRLRVLPLVGYTLHPDAKILDQGRSLSVARDAGVPAMYAEYHGGGGYDPVGVSAYVEGCLNVLAELGMIQATRTARPEPLIVEDARPGSGHMQVNHPSPCEGFFEPAVTLGQRVCRDDLLGTVSDLLGTRVEPIHSAHNGLVLVLHTFGRIDTGESAGVVLECETGADR
jgi:predicted deacylase